jgi:hypothetical protein
MPNSVRPLAGTPGPSPAVLLQPTSIPVTGIATNPVDLDSTTLDPEHSAAGSGLLALGTEPLSVDLNQYQWFFSPAKGQQELTVLAGLTNYKATSDSFWQTCEMQTVRMTGCINYLTNLARYLGVGPKELAEEVQTLKKQNKSSLKMIAEGQQTQVKQECLRELEAKNREMERTLASMRKLL